MTSKKSSVVDIYCGAGGTSFGAQEAGLHVAYGLDRNRYAVETFSHNHPDAYGDVHDVAQVTARDVLERGKIDKVDYLLSGPNCQAVSTMGLFYDADPRNLLFVHLARLIDEFSALGCRPGTVVIENVPGIAFQRNVKFIQDLVKFFLDRKYRCAADVVNFASWGLPQLRYRFVLVATAHGFEPTLPAPIANVVTGEGLVTTWQAIGDLAGIAPTANGVPANALVSREELTKYQRSMRGLNGRVANHHVGRTAPIDLQRIATVPQGGSWKDIPPELMPERFSRVRMTDYKTLYGRLLEDHPAYTISASYANVTSGCFTHPRHDRPLTVREGCRLQGFPDHFEVLGPVPAQYRQIGNAVPALAARKLIEHLEALRQGMDPPAVGMRLDQELLFGHETVKLPVLTPRYQRVGYGSGTYWPKGWGKSESPDKRLTSATDYRISTEPVRWRRIDWRRDREERLGAAFEALEGLDQIDWSGCLSSAPNEKHLAVLVDRESASSDGPGHTDLAKEHFLEFLLPTTSLLAAVLHGRSGHKDVVVRADFGLTAEWLHQLLGRFATKFSRPFRVVDSAGRVEGSPRAKRTLWLTSTPWLPDVEDGRVSAVFVVSPFADQASTLELPRDTAFQSVQSAAEHVRIRAIRAPWNEVLRAVGPRTRENPAKEDETAFARTR